MGVPGPMAVSAALPPVRRPVPGALSAPLPALVRRIRNHAGRPGPYIETLALAMASLVIRCRFHLLVRLWSYSLSFYRLSYLVLCLEQRRRGSSSDVLAEHTLSVLRSAGVVA